MNKSNKIEKPITLLRNDFVTNIVDLCNNSGLPFFVVEDVLKGLIREVHDAAQHQLSEDTKRYTELLEAQDKV